MKKILVFLCAMVLLSLYAGSSYAELIDRGGGLIYDSDQNITWLQEANYAVTELSDGFVDNMIGQEIDGHILEASDFSSKFLPLGTYTGEMTWWGARAWADQLIFGGYDDWRLPTTVDEPHDFGYDGTTTVGYNITTSEMGYMYYENLGNLGYYNADTGIYPNPLGYGPNNTSYFDSIMPHVYWSGTEYDEPYGGWRFGFHIGIQVGGHWADPCYAWAVRDGDVVPVPEPATMLFLGSGLIGLAWFRKKLKK